MKTKTIAILLTLLLAIGACASGSNDMANDTHYGITTQTAPAFSPTQAPALPAPEAWVSNEDSLQFSGQVRSAETHLPTPEHPWQSPAETAAISFTLSIDTAAYRNVARIINSGNRPHPDAVRIHEMLNYFSYEIVTPLVPGSPFSIYTEIGQSPFNPHNYLAFVRVRAQDIDRTALPASNLTFLIDTSGSMAPANRLPLVQQALGLIVPALGAEDTVSVVTYAGCARVLLDSVPGHQHEYIMAAIHSLEARGHTAGGPGISTAYTLAMANFSPDMNNRIILATDGDFNLGPSTTSELYEMMAEYNQRGIYMTILGFGMGNFRDDMLETIARNGNANYHYIDTLQAAHKVFVEEFVSNMFVIAEDVRAQIEFNPDAVTHYRLIGYENRIIDNQQFHNDFANAGEIGVGSEVVLMFEFATHPGLLEENLFNVHIRYHPPGSPTSNLITTPTNLARHLPHNSSDFNFATAVAAFGHILRNSQYVGNMDYRQVLALASNNLGTDPGGHRLDFVQLVEAYGALQ